MRLQTRAVPSQRVNTKIAHLAHLLALSESTAFHILRLFLAFLFEISSSLAAWKTLVRQGRDRAAAHERIVSLIILLTASSSGAVKPKGAVTRSPSISQRSHAVLSRSPSDRNRLTLKKDRAMSKSVAPAPRLKLLMSARSRLKYAVMPTGGEFGAVIWHMALAFLEIGLDTVEFDSPALDRPDR